MNYLGDIKVGLQTGENTKFLRYWWEVDFNNIGFSSINCEDSKNTNKKWFPYNKGGSFRKWWGNQEFIINWENDGEELRNFKKSVLRNSQFYFHQSLSWSKISSGKIAFRYYPNGFIFDVAGCSVFVDDYLNYIFGFLNSNACGNILDLISPTLNYEVGHIASLPIIIDENKVEDINNIVLENINICKDDCRNTSILCVVEQPKDVILFENIGTFTGRYHVLDGLISPLDGVNPEDLHITDLVERVQRDNIKEIVIAVTPSIEG